MLQDVVELRKNNWVPRRADAAPLTIDDLHKKIEEEVKTAAIEQFNYEENKKAERKKEDNRGKPRGDSKLDIY